MLNGAYSRTAYEFVNTSRHLCTIGCVIVACHRRGRGCEGPAVIEAVNEVTEVDEEVERGLNVDEKEDEGAPILNIFDILYNCPFLEVGSDDDSE